MRRGGRRFAILGLAALAGCSLIASPEIYYDWTPAQLRAFETFANQSLAEAPESAGPRVASTAVPWAIDPLCRSRYPASPNGAAPTRQAILDDCGRRAPDRDFIAISISGGGTKSAVFSAEALFALQGWGVLDRVDVISSVSGGSFTAALYAVSCDPAEIARHKEHGASPNLAREADLCDAQRPRIPWHYNTVMQQVGSDLLLPLALRRYNPVDLVRRGTTHRNAAGVLAEVMGDTLYEREALGRAVTFADLNPRRPNLVLNATNTSRYRRYIQQHLPPERHRLLDDSERAHFAFLDYYFRDLLSSNLSTYPLANAVAASAAFPLIIDYVTLGSFTGCEPRDGTPPPQPCVKFIHLTDGGAHDNHGITEVRLMLREVLGPAPPAAAPVPQRVLALIIDSSVIGSTGTEEDDPSQRSLLTAVMPFRPGNVSEAVDRTMDSNAAQRKRDFQRYLNDRIAAGGGLVWAKALDIGIEPLDRWAAETRESPAGLDGRARAADKIGDAGFRQRLGLGNIHPQCFYDALTYTPTNFHLNADVAVCLRHAARWAVAQRMVQICRDGALDASERFGINCGLLDGGTLGLPELPACDFGKAYESLDYFRSPVRAREHIAAHKDQPQFHGLCQPLPDGARR